MKPLGQYLIIDEAPEEAIKTEGGLLLTEKQGQVRYKKGVILKTPDGLDILSPGDTIYYDKNAGQVLDVEGIDYTIILFRDVVVVL